MAQLRYLNQIKMKKIMMIAALIAAIAFSASAQKIDATKVPTAVKASFSKQFPGSVAKWEKEDGKFEAGFKKGRLYHKCPF